MAIDTAGKRASALGVGLAPGTGPLPIPDGAIDAGDREQLAGDYSGIAAAAPSAFTADVFRGGTAYSSAGVMGTSFLADASPVPAGSIFLAGFAHASDGKRYVAAWPSNNSVVYLGGIAARPDGAMCINAAGSIVANRGPIGVTFRGEVVAANDTPDLIAQGYGLKSTGVLCVSAVS